MRNFIRNSLVALGKKAPQVPAAAPPPPPPARLNRRQRRQQELGQRRTKAQIDRALERALTTPRSKDTFIVTDAQGREFEAVLGIDKGIGPDRTVLVTQDGDQYTAQQHEPTECHPTPPNDRG
jgi:hypothetical protein